MAAGALFLVVLLVGLAIPVLLWLAIESETDRTDVMDRESAERDARRDEGDDDW